MTAPTSNRGGYRKPTNPAPVSGPGRRSRRTDGGPADTRQPMRSLPDADYGEQKTYRQDQRGAPMAGTAGPGGAAPPEMQPADLSNVTPFGAATTRPDEPVTSGADAGAGPGTEALGLPTGDNDPGMQYLRQNLGTFELMASQPQASDAFRQFVRRVRSLV